MRVIYPIILTCLLISSACVSKRSAAPPPPIPERYSLPLVEDEAPTPVEGAIYNARSKNIYQDSRAHQVGDIVMVKIVETSSGKKTAETKTSRDSSLKGGISSLFGYEKLLTGKNSSHTPSLTSMNTNIEKEFNGKGETKRDSSVTATLSARVVNTTMEGNLMIRGYREVRVNNETQHIILSGLIRPEDISTDNSVLSSFIADARIEYTGTGALASKQQPGWLANALDVLWPF